LIFVFLIIHSYAFCQNKYYLEASTNYSLIPTLTETLKITIPVPSTGFSHVYTNPTTIKESYASKFGFDIQGGIIKKLSNKFELDAGIGVSMVNYHKKIEIISNYENVEVPSINETVQTNIETIYGFSQIHSFDSILINSSDRYELWGEDLGKIGKTKIYYLSFPINVSYQIINYKLTIGTGLSPSIIIYSSEIKINDDLTPDVIKNDKTSDGLANLVLSTNIHLQYHIFSTFWIKSEFQQGVSDIYDEGSNAKYRLVKFGVKYYL